MHTQGETGRDIERDEQIHRQRQTETDTEREGETQRQIQRERERERERRIHTKREFDLENFLLHGL